MYVYDWVGCWLESRNIVNEYEVSYFVCVNTLFMIRFMGFFKLVVKSELFSSLYFYLKNMKLQHVK